MAIPILNHLNVKGNLTLNDYKLQDFVVDHSTEGDAGNTAGKLIYDSGTLKYYDGSSWQSLGTSSGTMSSWVLEDGDGTEVSIADAKEIKFVEGGGLDINWTDVSTGSDADPYDLTFTLDISGYSAVTPASGDSFLTLDSDGSTEQRTTVDALATLFAGSGLSASSGVLSVDTLNQDTTGTAAIATTVTVADESSDTTCFPLFVTAATGNLAPKSGTNLTFNSSSGLLTATAFAGDITGDVTGTSSLVTVTDSNANTAFPVVFNNESNALLDDTGAFTYNPNSGTLSVANLVVSGTQTISNETVQVVENNTILFEGATDDTNETKLTVVDPTADRTISLPNATGTVVLEDNTATLTNKTIAISQVTELSNLTATEGAQLENINSVTISNAQWGYVGALDQGLTTTSDVAFNSLDIEGNVDINGTTNLDAVDIDGAVQIDAAVTVGVDDTGYDVKFFGATTGKYMLWDASADTLILTGELDAGSLDISGNADIDGTLEADAITVNGTALNTVIDNRIKVVQKTATVDVSSLVNNVFKCNIAHNMNSNNLIVKLYDGTTFLDVFADVDRTDANTLQITFSHEPSNDIVVVIQEIIGDNIAAGSNITYPSS